MNNLRKFQQLLNEGISQQDLADTLCARLETRYPDIYNKYDYDTVYRAVDDVASFHAGAEELGTSDIGMMLRSVIKRLEEYQGVEEGVGSDLAKLGGATALALGAGIWANNTDNNSGNIASIQGKEHTKKELPSDMNKVTLTKDDKGNSVYVWTVKQGMKPQYTYHYYAPASGVKEDAAKDTEQKYSVIIDAIDHGVLGAITVSASSPDEAKQKVIAGVKRAWAKRGDQLMVRSVKVKPVQGVAEGQLDEFGGGGFPKTPKYKVGDSVMVKGYQGVGKIAYIKHRNDVGVIIKEPSPLRVVTTIDELIPKQGVAEEQLDELKCWTGYKRVPGTKSGAPGSCEKINELSTEKLAQYKKAAGADASKADKEGNFERGNKRFSGIVKATKKQFDNETKPKRESAIMKGIVDETLGTPYPGTYEQENKPFMRKGPKRTMKLTTEGNKNVGR